MNGSPLRSRNIPSWSENKAISVLLGVCKTMEHLTPFAMQEWTDEFITNSQHELIGMVKDWKYDYGADNKACSAMLLWMVLKLNPEAEIDATLLQPFQHS